jgi:ATP-dependent RNA helicase RhlE
MQVQRMRRRANIVAGTPVRICDLMVTGELKLNQVSQFVLDEDDCMLDLGFFCDLRRIVAGLPDKRQSSLFSVTMPPGVATLAETLLDNPLRVDRARSAPAPLPIGQQVHFVEPAGKRSLLGRLPADPALSRIIVFTRTKQGTNQVPDALDTGGIRVAALHRTKSQPARQKALEQFLACLARVLVATTARGIAVMSQVINFDLPTQPDDNVHRIGRTARAGASGVAISFCDSTQQAALRAVERMTGTRLQIAGSLPPAIQPQHTQARNEYRPSRRRRREVPRPGFGLRLH